MNSLGHKNFVSFPNIYGSVEVRRRVDKGDEPYGGCLGVSYKSSGSRLRWEMNTERDCQRERVLITELL